MFKGINAKFNPNNSDNKLFKLLQDFQILLGLKEENWKRGINDYIPYYFYSFNLNQLGSSGWCTTLCSSGDDQILLSIGINFKPKSKPDDLYLEFLAANLFFADQHGPYWSYNHGSLYLRIIISTETLDVKSLKQKLEFLMENKDHIINTLRERGIE